MGIMWCKSHSSRKQRNLGGSVYHPEKCEPSVNPMVFIPSLIELIFLGLVLQSWLHVQFFDRNGNANFRNYCIASTIWETKTIKWLASTKKKRLFVCLLLLFDEEVDDGKTNEEPRNKTWIWPWLPRRMERGLYHQLFQELAVENTCSFQELCEWIKNVFFFGG